MEFGTIPVISSVTEPDLEVIAPVRDAGLTRDAAIAYAEERGIPIPVTKSSPYSIDENLWGRTIECGIIEDPWVAPPADAYEWTVDPASTPDEPETIVIGFEGGAPVALDGSGVVRAKAWKKGDPEPEAWNIEVPHAHAHERTRRGRRGRMA